VISVLFLDRSNPMFVVWIKEFSKFMDDSSVRILFLSDKEASGTFGNLEIINVQDVPQSLSLADLQKKYTFSVFRTLVPERAFVDYSSFRRSQCYSRFTLEEIEQRAQPYYNALDYVIRERADLVIEGLADNFMTAAAGEIARHYQKAFRMAFVYYWWTDGIILVDRQDQTSSYVDRDYVDFYSRPELVGREEMNKLFSTKKLILSYAGVDGMYRFKMRFAQILNRFKSYEPPSVWNWIQRRTGWAFSKFLISRFIKKHRDLPKEETFVLFPLHVTPEATLLGSSPEYADQFTLIKNISMNLPLGVTLYVKDHPYQFVGDGLNFDFYRRLTVLANVKYLPGDVSLNDLLSNPNCLAVTTINGTVGLEAAMKRKPVFVFGRPIYGAADCFIKPRDFDEFRARIIDVWQGRFVFDENALYAILKAIDNNVIRADVDMNAHRGWKDVAFATFPIYAKFINGKTWQGEHVLSGEKA